MTRFVGLVIFGTRNCSPGLPGKLPRVFRHAAKYGLFRHAGFPRFFAACRLMRGNTVGTAAFVDFLNQVTNIRYGEGDRSFGH